MPHTVSDGLPEKCRKPAAARKDAGSAGSGWIGKRKIRWISDLKVICAKQFETGPLK